MKHKHADLIHAWADGAKIECKQADGSWFDGDGETPPSWNEDYEYRIKPEPKPDVVESVTLWRTNGYEMTIVGEFRLVTDGETGKLKSAEML